MDPTTLRLPEDLAEALGDEATEYGYGSRSEYIRQILRHRPDTDPNTHSEGDRYRTEYAGDVDDLRERVADLEARVEALEASGRSDDGPTRREPEAGRDDQRVGSEGEPEHAPSDAAHDDGRPHDPDNSTTDLMTRFEALPDAVEAAIDDLDVPGRPERVKETRREAIAFAWAYLREHGETASRELATATWEAFKDDPDLNYSASASRFDAYTMWDSCVRDALKELPGVLGPGERGDGYRFTGLDE